MKASQWGQTARALIGQATLAPSSHNTQPWRFRVSESMIGLYADRTRALPVNDPCDRELVISCGCALMNLRVAAARKGFSPDVVLLPQDQEQDLLATLSVPENSKASAEDAKLADFIAARRTCRKHFARRELTEALRKQLMDAAQREGVRLVPLLDDRSRQRVAALVGEGDAVQWNDPSWRRELAAWMHPRRKGDGLTVPAAAAPLAQYVVRTFDIGDRVAAKDEQLVEASPLLAVLSTDGDTVRDWLLAGQAMQRVLLVGCQNGVQASYFNQAVEIASLRKQLESLAGAGVPQILLRFGYPLEVVRASPRRPLDDVIEYCNE